MFIEYGVNEYGELVYIGQVGRGRTELHCPYCGGLLVARKGQVKVPHFAHADETCRQAERDTSVIAIPAYDNFNLRLPPKVITALLAFPNLQYASEYELLERHDLITFNKFARNHRGEYELTKRGKIPRGELSLQLFSAEQEAMILAHHAELEARALEVYRQSGPDEIDLATALTDLRLYRAQWRRILSTTLYFLIIGGSTLRKIGVTTRTVSERVVEVAADMRGYLENSLDKSIRVLGTWEHRGNVELYFKYRYQRYNAPQGNLTEYYEVSFEEGAAMLADLKRMKPKMLTDIERAVIAGEPPEVERMIERDRIEAKRRDGIRAGLSRRVAQGKPTGRPEGLETRDQLLSKPTSRAVMKYLNSGLSLREIAALAGVAVNTVRKIKAALDGPQKT
jgi:hypothetical protein